MRKVVLAVLCCGICNVVYAADASVAQPWKDCYASLNDSTLTIGNSRVCQVFAWNKGDLKTVSLEDVQAGKKLVMQNPRSDIALGKTLGKVQSAQWKSDIVAGTVVSPHLEVEVTASFPHLEVRRVFRIYPECPAIGCDYYLRARNGEVPAFESKDAVLQHLGLPGAHWQYRAVEFYDRTDSINTLVYESEAISYLANTELRGNVLWGQSVLHDTNVFVVKEAPCSFVQLNYPGCDFRFSVKGLSVVGMGITAADLPANEWTRCYGLAIGVYDNGEGNDQGTTAGLVALRDYQKRLRRLDARRDEMIMMNTWGDRNKDAHVGEAFVNKELDACVRLGVTHLQIDDGWQQGLSKNSAQSTGKLWDQWKEEHWQPHAERFPHGFLPVVQHAKQQGVDLGLWFHPSNADDYANWSRDANIVVNLFRNFGIRYFKIDGIKLPTKRAEINLRRFFDRIQTETDGQVVINLDATADNRTGYHYFYEYGNIFLENRYTDFGRYYPCWTLRNLWMLSKYVPPEKLQIEFLNKWRNGNKYAADDPLAPGQVPFDYVFAVTMMAQPLAWFEGSGLPAEAFEQAAPIIKAYRQHQSAIHHGVILPIGDAPSGTGWTGFQSIAERDRGYVIVYREFNDQTSESIRLHKMSGKRVELKHICGHGSDFTAQADENGAIRFTLPAAHTFALYQYDSLKQ